MRSQDRSYTGSGWQTYNNGSWNNVNTQQAKQEGQQNAQSYQHDTHLA
jgi:hypothetical protein